MPYTQPFNQLDKNSADIAGGKGASLGEMLQSNIPVPDGYVVLSTTFDAFIKQADLVQEIEAILHHVNHQTISSVESASEKIQSLIKHAEMPTDIAHEILAEFKTLNSEFVAVRSSATAEDGADHAWAGQLESYLNTTQDDLLEKVQHCWASLFTPRAIFYRFEKGLHDTHISVAVVIQKMVNSEKSGIAFSVHPVTEDRNQLIIEAGLGLGEAIVSGSVTPDSYVVSKTPREIIDININHQNRALYRKIGGGNEWKELDAEGTKQVLTKSEILELSEIIMTIENHYGFPCDIEWAYENGKFYIVQSRPITTLSSSIETEKIHFEKAYTRDTTMIIQQGWNACVTNPFYASGTNPFIPPVIHYMNDGVIEIWENEKATQWIMDSVQDLIKSDEAKLISLVDQYEKDLIEIKEYWAKGPITDVDEFVKYVDRVFVVMKGFDCMYFPSVDERTPTHIRERMLKLRDADTYFDSNDKLMRASLIALYPDLKGYENCILKSEIKNPPSLEILKARKKSFIVIGEEFAEQTTIREYVANHPEYHFHIEIPPADSSTLIGQVGNKGYAKGIVRIMKRKEQISEAQEGDIIVSTMTTPDFVPAMQKATAIITDEGGITCHAAIVARELNKPCVIGTKFATEILKDGDEVEVDADNGVVRIINSNNESEIYNYVDNFFNTIGSNETFVYEGKYSPILLWTSWSNPKQYSNKLYNFTMPFIAMMKNDVTTYITDFNIYNKINEDYFNSYWEGKLSLEEIKSDSFRIFNDCKELYNDYLSSDFSSYSDSSLQDFAQRLEFLFSELCVVTSTYDLFGEKNARKIVKNDDFINRIWEDSSRSTIENFDLRRNKVLLDFIKSKKTDYRLIQYIYTDYFLPKSLDDIKNIIKDIKVENLVLEIKEREEKVYCQKKEYLNWYNSAEIKECKFADYIQTIIELRDIRKDPIGLIQCILYSIAEEFCRRLNIPLEYAYLLTPRDLSKGLSLLRGEKKSILLRKQGVIAISGAYDNINIFSNSLNNLKNYIKDRLRCEDNLSYIKGDTGSKGFVRGVVKIIKTSDTFSNFKKGEVLVTGMTRPEFVPLMKMASAIVTDEGGITCHAAIVSRELGIPCIIGTKFATQILKDGDLVEVDADKGIVRIIN